MKKVMKLSCERFGISLKEGYGGRGDHHKIRMVPAIKATKAGDDFRSPAASHWAAAASRMI